MDIDTALHDKTTMLGNQTVIDLAMALAGRDGEHYELVLVTRYGESKRKAKISRALENELAGVLDKVEVLMPKPFGGCPVMLMADFIAFVAEQVKKRAYRGQKVDFVVSAEARVLRACRAFGADTLLFKKGKKYVPTW